MSIALIKELQAVRPLLGEWGLSGIDYQILESIAYHENHRTHSMIRDGKIKDMEVLPAIGKDGSPIATVTTRRKQSYGRVTRDRLANLTKQNFTTFRFTGCDKLAHRWGIADGTFDRRLKVLTARGFVICLPVRGSQHKKVNRRVNPDLIRDMQAQLPAFEAAWQKKREAERKAREEESLLDLDLLDDVDEVDGGMVGHTSYAPNEDGWPEDDDDDFPE